MKTQQKTDYFERTTKTSLLLGEPAISGNLFLRNKPNFNHSNITATSCSTVVYNDLQTKPKNGANPNKANLKPISNTLKPSLFPGEPAIPSTLICKSKANFPNPSPILTPEKKGLMIIYALKNTKKANPIQTQYKANLRQSRRSGGEDGKYLFRGDMVFYLVWEDEN